MDFSLLVYSGLFTWLILPLLIFMASVIDVKQKWHRIRHMVRREPHNRDSDLGKQPKTMEKHLRVNM